MPPPKFRATFPLWNVAPKGVCVFKYLLCLCISSYDPGVAFGAPVNATITLPFIKCCPYLRLYRTMRLVRVSFVTSRHVTILSLSPHADSRSALLLPIPKAQHLDIVAQHLRRNPKRLAGYNNLVALPRSLEHPQPLAWIA